MSDVSTAEMAVLGYAIYARNEDGFWLGQDHEPVQWTPDIEGAKVFRASTGCEAFDNAASHLPVLRAQGWEAIIVAVFPPSTNHGKISRLRAMASERGGCNNPPSPPCS